MKIRSSELERFRLEGIIGEGAELQVFAATDAETGAQVVVKRAHPVLVGMAQHEAIDARIARTIELRIELTDAVCHLPELVAFTEPEPHNGYFGDSFENGYTVLIEERARGLPLAGSAMDGVKRMPIGLPQNLFALHPLNSHAERGLFSIHRDILDLVETFYCRGFLLLDLSPQNVFFDPLDGAIKVIDIGNLTVEQSATRRHEAVDLHNFYLELFKWYLTPEPPPQSLDGYAAPYGLDSVTMFRQNLEAMISRYSSGASDGWKDAAVGILHKVRERGYAGIAEFKSDFREYLSLEEERHKQFAQDDALMATWNQARDALREPYWRKFVFDAERDLQFYASG
jgi:serine/threonine protein kinase